MNTSALWQPAEYTITLPHPLASDLADAAGRLFDLVWRTTLNRPGFAVVRFAGPVDSRELRRVMLDLVAAMPVKFVPERFGRFDQQVSSRFHCDGAPPASLLLLGYEPTTVRSRLFIADSTRAAVEAGVPMLEFGTRFNPMVPGGEARYVPFVTELELPHGEPYILAINNSHLPLVPGAGNPLGVLHMAVITEPDPSARRVINSVGLTPDPGRAARDPEHFLTRDNLD